LFEQVKKNRFGFYELKNKPTKEELEDFYPNKYYQKDKGSYSHEYAEEEILNIQYKIERKYEIIKTLIEINGKKALRFLDIGCGEGWTLKFFKQKGWDVTGLDYSDYGMKKHNSEYIEFLIQGDIYKNIKEMLIEKESFDLIWLDNVLEHVVDPGNLLKETHKLLNDNGILMIQVPNDFSQIQQYLLKNNHISNPYWIVSPDHVSYFNKNGLLAICKEAGFVPERIMGNFPIDLNLFNQNTNYVEEKDKGKSCHYARVEIENFLHRSSLKKLNDLYQLLAEMNLGRNIIGFFSKYKGK